MISICTLPQGESCRYSLTSPFSPLTSHLYCISTLNLAKMALPGFCSL